MIMRKMLFMLALMLPMLTYAQVHERVDDFTGEKRAFTERVQLVRGMIYALSVEFEQESDSISLKCYLRAKRNFTLDEGESKLSLKMSDGSVMRFVCLEDERSSYQGNGIFKRNAEFNCSLSKDDIRKLSEVNATKFRLELHIGNIEHIEYEISKRHSRQLKEQAIAFLDYIGE